VLPGNDVMEVELDVVHLDADRITVDGVIRADGLPIYRLDGATLAAAPAPTATRTTLTRPTPAHGLLDHFDVQGDRGVGHLRLDPAVHPWLDQHRPTLTAAALPLAFAAEVAAEAAQLLAPHRRVVEIAELEASSWVHTADGPVDLIVVAFRAGDAVAVTLSVHEDNPRYPKLSGPKVKMKAVARTVRHEEPWPEPPSVPEVHTPVRHDVRDYYDGGHTFHGPVLQAMTTLHTGGEPGSGVARATLQAGDDRAATGLTELPHGGFVLDPVLLDAATHPMRSGSPEVWHDDLAAGHLAYPVRCEGLKLYGPRPIGAVQLTLQQVPSPSTSLVFDAWLVGPDGPWCSFRWTEAVTPAGPLLGLPAPKRRAMVFDRQPVSDAVVGLPHPEGGWVVRRADLVEPLPGTVVAQCCTDAERATYRALPAEERIGWSVARLAAKEAIRRHLRDRTGRDVHPATLGLLAMRPDRYVLVTCPSLTAQEWVDHLGPTRWHLCIDPGTSEARAWLRPADDRGRPPFAGLAVPATRGDE